MIRKLFRTLGFGLAIVASVAVILSGAAVLLAGAAAQSNRTCVTMPVGDATNACASTAFVSTAVLNAFGLVPVFNITGTGSVTGPGNYALGGGTLYTFTVPAASNFAVGTRVTLSNVDTFPTYTSTMFTGTIAGTTLTAIGSGPTAVGQTLVGPVGTVTANTTVTACPGGICGGAGAYTISNSITLAGASFTGTAAASPHGKQLTVTSVTGTIHIGDTIAGTGIAAGTTVLRQFSGTTGGNGVYLLSAASTSSGASLTTTPTLGSFAVGGGHCKTIAGLTVTRLCPGTPAITITSLGSSWDQPQNVPRLQIPHGASLRMFISGTGNDTANDGLGGCSGGSPFATLQAATNWLSENIDLRGSDPFTFQFCTGNYTPGTQETHFPVDIPGRNGGAGIRITGSPLGLQQCIDPSATSLNAGTGTVIDAQLPYVWLLVDCMTISAQSGVAVGASRGSWVIMSTGLIIGAGSGGSQLAAQSGKLLLDTNTTLIFAGDEGGNGFAFNFSGPGGGFYNTGGDIAWDAGSSTTFGYTNPIIAGAGVQINFGAAEFDVNGTIPSNVKLSQTQLFTGNPLPFGNSPGLSGGSCLTTGNSDVCATAPAGGSPGQVLMNGGGPQAGITGATSDGASITFAAGNLKLAGATSGNFASFGASNVVQDSGKALPSGAVVGTTDAQALSGKTFDTASNTWKLNGTTVSTAADMRAATEQGTTLLAVVAGTAVSTLADTSHFTASYDDYELIFDNVVCGTANTSLQLQVHSASAFQNTSYLNVAGGATTYFDVLQGGATFSNSSALGLSGTLTVTNANGSGVNKFMYILGAYYTGAAVAATNNRGVWTGGTSAIDGFQVLCGTGTISGSIKIYGRRNAL